MESADLLLSCRIVVAACATGSVGAVVIAAEVVVAAIAVAAAAVAAADAPSSRRQAVGDVVILSLTAFKSDGLDAGFSVFLGRKWRGEGSGQLCLLFWLLLLLLRVMAVALPLALSLPL